MITIQKWVVFLTYFMIPLLSVDGTKMINVTQSDSPSRTLAFGSCAKQYKPQQFWEAITKQLPDGWLWMGDVIYSNCSLPECIADGYQLLNSAPEYQKFKKDVPFIDGTWDDHDFGVNDGGREFRHKRESQSLLLDFLDVPKDSPRRLQEGVFTYRIFSIPDKEGLPPRRVKIILLDTRSQREQPWLPSLSEYHLPLGSIISAVLRMLTSIAGSVKLKFC